MPDAISTGPRAGIVISVGTQPRSSGACRSVGAAKGITLGGPATWSGLGTFGRMMQVGADRSNTEGSPNTPSLRLVYPGFWRFRWVVKPGVRTIKVSARQTVNAAPFPSLTVKANAAVGLVADSSASHAGGTGWSTVGPVVFTATAIGVVWVELWSNSQFSDNPVYFDHLVAT